MITQYTKKEKYYRLLWTILKSASTTRSRALLALPATSSSIIACN